MAVRHLAGTHMLQNSNGRGKRQKDPHMERKRKRKTSGSRLSLVFLCPHVHMSSLQTVLVLFKGGPAVALGGMAGNDTQSEVRNTYKAWKSFCLCLHWLFGTFKYLFWCSKTLKKGNIFFQNIIFSANICYNASSGESVALICSISWNEKAQAIEFVPKKDNISIMFF